MGMSSPSSTRITPGYAAALEMSTFLMSPCGTELRSSLVCSMRGKTRSSAYLVWPITFAIESTLRYGLPTTRSFFAPESLPEPPFGLDPLPAPPFDAPLLAAPSLGTIDTLLGRLCSFACHARGCQLHRFVNLDVAGAAAQVPGQRFANLLARWPRRVLEQRLRRQQNPRRAVAALRRAQLRETFLQRM